MKVLIFEPELAPRVASGEKKHTIRKRGTCAVGEMLSLRKWSARPYWSKQEEIKRVCCWRVRKLEVTATEMRINGTVLTQDEMAVFAQSDGFDSADEMIGFLQCAYGLPFAGETIEWEAEAAK